MACVTLKRSLDFDPLHSPSRPIKRRRWAFLTVFVTFDNCICHFHLTVFLTSDVSQWASLTDAAPAKEMLLESAAPPQNHQVSFIPCLCILTFTCNKPSFDPIL